MERDFIAPGDSVLLKIIFETKAYNSRVTKSPAIYTNADTLYGIYRVYMLATVIPRPDSLTPILVKPYKLDISQFGSTVRDALSFTLSNVTDSTLHLQPIASPDDFLNLTLASEIGPNADAQCAITLTELGKSSEFSESITFETDQPPGTRYTIPIKRRFFDPPDYASETACVEADSILDSP